MNIKDFTLRVRVTGWYKDNPTETSEWDVVMIDWEKGYLSLTNGHLNIGIHESDYKIEFFVIKNGRVALS